MFKSKYSSLDRFLKYVTFDTQSIGGSKVTPSTPGQKVLADVLAEELKAMGVPEVSCDEHAYVLASLPSNTKKKVPAIGFIAHIDTATEISGKDVKPRIVENYDGGDIKLNDEHTMSPSVFPSLLDHKGMDLVVTDGTTLLGADDKAGIAEIMGAVEYLIKHPEIEHGDVKIAFTPDEEVSHGASLLDLKKFGADFAYTIDGGEVGEITYENFNACQAIVKIHGRAVHPGSSKNKMLNAVMLGLEYVSMFPVYETPATTEGREGYYHCLGFVGETEEATLKFIIRDHCSKKFEERKEFMRKVTEWMKGKYGAERFELEIIEQYRNMREKLVGHEEVIEILEEAVRELGYTPVARAARGGTDGAALSWRGLPCPNFYIGGFNAHGRFEYIPVQNIEAATDTVIKILELAVKRAG